MSVAPPTPPDFPLATDNPEDFDDKAYDCFPYVADAADNCYANAQAAETAATNSESSATDSANSATASEASRQAADAASNYKGEWSSLTGALNKPSTVSNNGAFWALVNNLANVALSEPSPTNADWRFVSGTRWLPAYTASANIIPNAYSPVQATSTPVNMTLVAMSVGDFVVVQNSPISTQTVTLVNTLYTIRGSAGSISSGTDITLNAGDTAHFRVAASNILEAVEHA